MGEYVYFYEASTIPKLSMYNLANVQISNNELYIDGSNGEIFTPTIATEYTSGGNTRYKIKTTFYGPFIGGYLLINEEIELHNIIMTSKSYMLGMVTIFQNGKVVRIQSEYNERIGEVNTNFKQIVLDSSTFIAGEKAMVTYMPLILPNGTYPSDTRSNIVNHNKYIDLNITKPISKYILPKYPYIDPTIINSNMFRFSNGLYYFQANESIIYEPFIIYLNKYKLVYNKDYTIQGNTIVFNKLIEGQLNIHYYILADNLAYKIEMFRTDPTNNETTSRITDIISYCKVVK